MQPRFVALAAAFLASGALAQAGGAPAGGDKGPTTIDAERIEGVSDLEVNAQGRAEVKRDDTTIFGEVLRFNREFDRFEADGGARFEFGADRFFGPRMRYNAGDGTGVFESPSYRLERDPPGRGSAERIELLGPERYRVTKGTYTTCQPGRDDWYLEVGELDLDYEEDVGRARSAKLRFFDTTVLNLPWMSFSLDRQRKSGFLVPSYARSTRRGYEVSIPYYWNIAPEMDATLTAVMMSDRGAQLKTDYRYIGHTYSGEVKFEHLLEDKELKKSRTGFSLLHQQQITPQLFGRLDLNKVTDDRYFVDLSSRVNQAWTGNLQREGSLSYGGDLFGLSYGASLRLQRFQTLQDPLAPVGIPYHRVPQLNLHATRNDIGGIADFQLPAEYVRFTHPTLVEGQRTLFNPSVSFPLLAPGYFVTPKLGVRHVKYTLERAGPGQAGIQSSTAPWLSVDSGLIFDRPVTWFGENLTHTLEPRAFYVRIPYRDQSQMPVFDTGLYELNYASIFTENRFAGGDRIGDANELTLAATTRLLGANGQELFRALLGQRFYFQDERVGLAPGSPLRTHRRSDVLASVSGQVGRHWSFETAMQFNPREERAERYSAAVRYSPEIAKVLNLSYRFNRNILRQVDVSGQWPIAPGWFGIGRLNYSFPDRLVLEGLAGVEYNAGCWVFRAVARRIQAAVQTTSTELLFQLEFNGFGQFGTGDALTLLQRTVPGYAQTNPSDRSLVPPSLQRRLPYEQVY